MFDYCNIRAIFTEGKTPSLYGKHKVRIARSFWRAKLAVITSCDVFNMTPLLNNLLDLWKSANALTLLAHIMYHTNDRVLLVQKSIKTLNQEGATTKDINNQLINSSLFQTTAFRQKALHETRETVTVLIEE